MAIFDRPLSRHISETVLDKTKVAILITSRNVYMRFRLVPKSMTLRDPWPGFQGHGRQNGDFRPL